MNSRYPRVVKCCAPQFANSAPNGSKKAIAVSLGYQSVDLAAMQDMDFRTLDCPKVNLR